jgi:hypothetical protein
MPEPITKQLRLRIAWLKWVGKTHAWIADVLGCSVRSTQRIWAYYKATGQVGGDPVKRNRFVHLGLADQTELNKLMHRARGVLPFIRGVRYSVLGAPHLVRPLYSLYLLG